MEEKETLTVVREDGREVEVEVLSYFTLKSNNKEYLIYTENKIDKNGNVEVSTSEVVTHEDGSVTLEGVESEEVWAEIKQVMIDIAKGE